MLIGDKKAVLIILAKSNPSEAPSKCCKDFPRSVLSPEADDRPLSFFTSLQNIEGLQSFKWAAQSGLVLLQSAGFSFPVYTIPQETKDWQVSLGKGLLTSSNKLFQSLVNPGWLVVLDCFFSWFQVS